MKKDAKKKKYNYVDVSDPANLSRITFLASREKDDYAETANILLSGAVNRAIYLVSRDGIQIQMSHETSAFDPNQMLQATEAYLAANEDKPLLFTRIAAQILREVCLIKSMSEGENPDDLEFNLWLPKYLASAFELGNLNNLALMLETGHIDDFGKTIYSLTNGKSKSGDIRGKQLQEAAQAWKTEYLPEAIKIMKERPNLTRSGLATQLLLQFGDDRSHRTVETWLKDEVEPLGFIPRRSRKKLG